MKKYIFLVLIIFLSSIASAQTITGIVKYKKNNSKGESLPYASVYWPEMKTSVETDSKGKFSLNRKNISRVILIASYIGYTRDTVILESGQNYAEFLLEEQNELNAVKIIGVQNGSFLSKTTPLKTEVISAAGLCKMACCNLAESFENSASVTVGYSDAITGARQIRLLGLNGTYTQMLDENRPAMRGLASPFGLSYVPGQWLESIQIAKGPSSVVNGLEAITGQINLEHRKPTDEKPLFINLFLGSNLRSEANIASSLQLNEKWSTIVLGHISNDPLGHDGNHDGFRDEPVASQFNFSNRWLYFAPNGLQLRMGISALTDNRLAGENEFDSSNEQSISLWGSKIYNEHINGYVKLGIPLNANNSSNIAGVVDYTYHNINSFFGMKDYNGNQNSFFFNLIYQNQINEKHKIVAGISGLSDNFNEILKDFYTTSLGSETSIHNLDKTESSLGAYAEYTYNNSEKLTIVAGLRADNNSKYGILFAPRFNIKYSPTENLVFRSNIGRGYRSPNIIADNLGILSTGRKIEFESNLDIEDAWTYGVNATGYFKLGDGEKSTVSLEYFRTSFNKQVIVDQERDFSKVSIYNLNGRSYTNNWQIDFTTEPINRFKILATMRFTHSKAELEGMGLVERPLTNRYKGVINLQYATAMNKWTFDFTTQLNGLSRMPNFMAVMSLPVGMVESPAYTILFAQITKKYKDLDIYIGGENLTGYRQDHAIINHQDPYSTGFNSTVIWGPLMGVKLYAGIRFTIWK